jgi:tetratricopeptide (TPR) repeat protein
MDKPEEKLKKFNNNLLVRNLIYPLDYFMQRKVKDILLFIILILFIPFYNVISQNDYENAKILFQKSLECNDDTIKVNLRKKIIKISPNSEFGSYSNGYLADFQGAHRISAEYFSKAIEKEPNFHLAYRNRAMEFFALEKYDKAVDDFDIVLDLNQYDTVALLYKGKCLEKQNKYDDAYFCYSTAIKINSNYAIAYYYRGCLHYDHIDRQGEKCKNDFFKVLELCPNYDSKYILIKNYYKDYYDKLIKNNEYDYKTYFNLGKIFYDKNNYSEAIKYYSLAIKMEPKDWDIYNFRGNAKGKMNDYFGAIDDYDKALKLNNNYWGLYYNKGLMYLQLKKYKLALTEFSKAKNLNIFYFSLFIAISQTYKEMEEYEKGITELDSLLTLYPYYAKGYEERANIYLLQEYYDNWVKDYEKKVEVGNFPEQEYCELAEKYIEINRKANSDSYNAPSDSDYEKGYKKAIKYINKALEWNKNNPNIYYKRAEYYYKLYMITKNSNYKDNACKDWSTSGQLGSDKAYDQIKYNCNYSDKK